MIKTLDIKALAYLVRHSRREKVNKPDFLAASLQFLRWLVVKEIHFCYIYCLQNVLPSSRHCLYYQLFAEQRLRALKKSVFVVLE